MSRSIVVLIVVLVVVVGGLFWLAGRHGEKPMTHVEKVVPIENLAH
jgi:hypothetical protein